MAWFQNMRDGVVCVCVCVRGMSIIPTILAIITERGTYTRPFMVIQF